MTSQTCVAWGSRSPFIARAAIVLGVALAVVPTLALAETQISGTPNAVRVEAKNASVEEILVALTDAFDVQFRSSANLEKKLTGTYAGTLQQVVTHVLRGYNFVVKSGEKGIEITLLGTGKAVAVVGASPASKAPVRRRVDAAAEPSPAANAADQPVPVASSTGPLPVIKVAEGPPSIPSATPPASGPVPAPVPGTGATAAPTPAPPAPGSNPGPSPVPTPGTGSATLLPPPVTGMTNPAGPPLATAPTAEPPPR